MLFRTIRRDFISAVGALIFLCGPAYALTESPEYFVDFNIDYLGNNPELYNITLLDSGAYFGAGDWTETPLVPGGGPQSFPMTISIPVVPTYAAFLADYTDRDNVTHVVLGVNPDVDYALFGQNWSAVFGDDAISEAELDSDLKAIHSNNTSFDDYLAAFDEITDFYYDNLTHINSPYYLPQVPILNGLIPVGGSFDLIAFSDGVSLGSGDTSDFSNGVAGSVPEPSTWAMLLVGFGALAALSLRRGRLLGQTLNS
jgi:PEP-CTERM motif